MFIHQMLRAVESVDTLDGPADALERLTRRLPPQSRLVRLLRGSWLGHPVHPLLITLPLGAWMSSLAFDVVIKDRDAARRLIAIGLVATPPAVVAGLADYPLLSARQRRVGVTHAAFNAVATLAFLRSYRCRRRGRDRRAITYSLIGIAAISVGGALGGHLSYAQGAGMLRWQPVRSAVHLRGEHQRAA